MLRTASLTLILVCLAGASAQTSVWSGVKPLFAPPGWMLRIFPMSSAPRSSG